MIVGLGSDLCNIERIQASGSTAMSSESGNCSARASVVRPDPGPMSTSGRLVSLSTWRSTSAVISIRYDSSSPRFHSANTSAICAGEYPVA